MTSRQRGGKTFVHLGEGERLCRPSPAAQAPSEAADSASEKSEQKPASPPAGHGFLATGLIAATHVCCASAGGRILTFDIGELKVMEKGGRGLTLIALEGGDTLAGAAAYARSVRIHGTGRGGKPREETLEIRSLNNARAARGRKGKAADLGFKPAGVDRVV